MAIYGIGSKYGGQEEKLPEFINSGFAFIGYDEADAPAVFNAFKATKVGDIIFIKSSSPSSGLYIKAVGIITGRDLVKDQISNLGWGKKTQWLWHMKLDPTKEGIENIKMGKIVDGMTHMRMGTFYEEFGPEVQERVLALLIKGE